MTKHSSKIAEWKKLADIDYYGMFVKAYIPFNAWLNDNFSEPKDREKINRIKSKPNRFRDKITNLLNSPSQEGANFRNSIGALHHCLEICPLQNQGETITFSDVYIGKILKMFLRTNIEASVFVCNMAMVEIKPKPLV